MWCMVSSSRNACSISGLLFNSVAACCPNIAAILSVGQVSITDRGSKCQGFFVIKY